MSESTKKSAWPTIIGAIALIAFAAVLFRMQQPPKYDGPIKYVDLTAANFNQVVSETDQPVLVDFYADWCGPCRMMAPTIAELAVEMEGSAIVAKLDIDEAQTIAARHDISSIPALVIFKDGQEVQRFVGVTDKSTLAEALQQYATPGMESPSPGDDG